MKFLVDAQLPRRLAIWLREAGHDALHTLDLALGNRTADGDLARLAVREQRIVITKDADFVQSYLVSREPDKLLLVTTGNIANTDLERLMRTNLQASLQHSNRTISWKSAAPVWSSTNSRALKPPRSPALFPSASIPAARSAARRGAPG